MQIAHPVFCLLIVIIFYVLENFDYLKRFGVQLPLLPHFIRWIILFVLSIPAIVFYEKYRSERNLLKGEESKRELEIVSVLNELLREKEPTIEYHAKRTAQLTRSLCEVLNLDEEVVRVIVFAALFHDIGKLFLDKKLLGTHGMMTEDEKKEYHLHPIFSQRILEKIQFYPGAGLIVKHHHERWDGKGYPEGLSGENIPLGSRIISVVDVYDSLISGLHSKTRVKPEDALLRIREEGGTKFDLSIVAVFEKAMTQELISMEDRSGTKPS